MHLTVDIEKKLPGFPLKLQFEVKDQRVALLGASGSGKSITLKCIAGIEKPDKGRIVLNNTVLFDSERGINLPPQKRRVGYLFQNYALFPHLTVSQNIGIGIHHNADKPERIRKLLKAFRLQGLEESYPPKLSGGEQQRAALARMLASEPVLILLDEPFSALDGFMREELRQMLPDMLPESGRAYLLVTHDVDEAYRLSDRILVLDQGRQAAFDVKENVINKPPNLATARLTGCENIAPVRIAAGNSYEVPEWGCVLETGYARPNADYIGIRAHRIDFTGNGAKRNAMPYDILKIIEGRFEVTLLLRLKRDGESGSSAIRAGIGRAKWHELSRNGFPRYVCLPPEDLMLFEHA